jgi:hypothetical protein
MTNGGSGNYRARRLERERKRRMPTDSRSPQGHGAAPVDADDRARRVAAAACGWCCGPISLGRRGPIAKWCSATCRHRAWEQSRAAASGRSAVTVLERFVEIARPVAPTRLDWPGLLHELARQLDDGRVYDRDLRGLDDAVELVVQALYRRTSLRAWRSQEDRYN